jgi:tRNA pseudouridine13 synthase
VVNFLAHNPRNFRTALTYIRQDLRSLHLAAFQSHLWNKLLAEFLSDHFRPQQLSAADVGRERLVFHRQPTREQLALLSSATLPLPSARLHLEAGPTQDLFERVLAREGLALRELRVKYPRDSFFSKGERAVTFAPQNLRHETAPDDLYPGRQKLHLAFDLPRGSYATVLVKKIMLPAAG